MHKRPRDNQRARYHRAEKIFREEFDTRLGSLESCQALVDQVQNAPAWRRLLGRRGFTEVPGVLLADGRGRRRPCSDPWAEDHWRIALPRHVRTKVIVLRQLAFFATPRKYAYHGPEFVVALLDLVGRFMGAEAESAFKQILAEQNVSRAGAVGEPSNDPAVVRPVPRVPRSKFTYPRPRRSQRPRDAQRARVYRAENKVLGEIGCRCQTGCSRISCSFWRGERPLIPQWGRSSL